MNHDAFVPNYLTDILKNFPKGPFLRMEHTQSLCKETVRGSLKVEFAVRPPANRVAAIPEDATAKASFP